MSAIGTATSGLLASESRINVSASRIATADISNRVAQRNDARDAVVSRIDSRNDSQRDLQAEQVQTQLAQTQAIKNNQEIDVAAELVKSQLAQNDFSANATVIKSEKKRVGSLVDIFA